MNDDYAFNVPVRDPLAKLPKLAQRLGVSESSEGFLISTLDGKCYSIIDLIEAVLDRLDRVVEKET